MSRRLPAAATGTMAAAVALSAWAGPGPLAATVLATTLALALGWPRLLGLPTQRGSATVLSTCGAAAVLVVALAPGAPLQWLPSVLAVSVLAAFAHQLLRRDMRPRLVESVTGVVAGVVCVELGAAWLAVLDHGGGQLVAAAATAVVAAAVATAMPWPQRYTDPLAVVAGAVFGALAALALAEVDLAPAGLLGLALGAVVAGLDRLFLHLPATTSRRAGIAVGASVVSGCGIVAYLGSRLVG